MNTKQFVALALAAAALLSSCAKENLSEFNTASGDLIPISVNGSIKQEATKATADGFVGGDAVGLFAVNYINDNAQAGTLVAEGNQADNVKYVFDEANHKWVPVKPVYYKDINTHADLYLYYPYQKSISDVNAAGFEVQKDQSSAATETSLSGYEASDFLWGKGEDITPSQSAVNIKLSHKVAAVKVTLVEGEGFEDGEFDSLEKSIILTNTTRKATINYATGEVTPLGAPQMDGIVMCPQSDGSWRAIAVPQNVVAGTQLFAITVNGMSYSFKQGEATEYQSGKQTEFTITVKKKSPSGELEFTLTNAQITDWTEDLNTHGGEARQYFVVNVSEPGTLGATIKAMGKNPDKIRNLKVVGNVRDNDFYFMRDSMAILEAVNMRESIIKPSGNFFLQYTVSPDETDSYWKLKYGDDYQSGGWPGFYDNEEGNIPPRAFGNKASLCYFVFPEHVLRIACDAFENTNLTGALVIPEDVELIDDNAFTNTNISSITFNSKTQVIGREAFNNCTSLTGRLILPELLRGIGYRAFENCSFSGDLYLPDELEFIARQALLSMGVFTSGLVLPDKINALDYAFSNTRFKGNLDLNNCTVINGECFKDCGFSGELIIPEGVIEIPNGCFQGNIISKVACPESLRKIGERAFSGNQRLEEIEFKEGLISIGSNAFSYCSTLLALKLPATLQSIQSRAFEDCFYISNITCNAVEPPTIQCDTFDGVAKDNFSLEVPERSIIRYQTEVGWNEFKRITAHYDFSIGRTRMRALNAEMERTYVLRCPSGFDWYVSSKPDWITVNPLSGTGKTDVTITISTMPRTQEEFEVNTGSFQNPEYKNYKGRKGSVVFSLSGKDYSCKLDAEQYDYDKADGDVITYQTKSVGNGIDVVFIGEGYDARDIVDGKFETDCENGYGHFFNAEPYKTYKGYFNVYSVISQADESGIENVNTIRTGKFSYDGYYFIENALQWAKKANNQMDLTKAVVINLDNSDEYYGYTYMFADGCAIAVVPISKDEYPYDFRGIIQHEAGGHAFGKLGDEYIYHNAYIHSCGCYCCDHPGMANSQYDTFKGLGWFKNLSTSFDYSQVPWSHLLYHPKYSNRVDMYEGGYMHARGMFRSEITSCMNNNIPYFSAISRQAIVERIKEYAGETFDFDDFVAKDNFDVGTKSSVRNFDWTFGVDPKWNRGTEKGSIIYMGEHPDYSKIK